MVRFTSTKTFPPVSNNWGFFGNEEFDKGGGVLYIGSKGKLMHGTYAQSPRLLGAAANAPKPPQTYKRIPTSHEINWIDAIRGGERPYSNFEIASPFTETALLGNVAIRLKGTKLEYNGQDMKFTNSEEAAAGLTVRR